MSDRNVVASRVVDPEVMKLWGDDFKHLISVRDDIASGVITKEEIDMSTWADRRSCGTVACIAGHVMLRNGTIKESTRGSASFHIWLDRMQEPCSALFCPWEKHSGPPSSYWDQPERIVRAIDTYIETGEPDWGNGP